MRDICREVLADPETLLEWGVAQAEDGSLDTSIAMARSAVKDIEGQINRLQNRLALVPDSLVPKIISQPEGLGTRLHTAQQELDELLAQQAARERLRELKASVAGWRKNEKSRLDELTPVFMPRSTRMAIGLNGPLACASIRGYSGRGHSSPVCLSRLTGGPSQIKGATLHTRPGPLAI